MDVEPRENKTEIQLFSPISTFTDPHFKDVMIAALKITAIECLKERLNEDLPINDIKISPLGFSCFLSIRHKFDLDQRQNNNNSSDLTLIETIKFNKFSEITSHIDSDMVYAKFLHINYDSLKTSDTSTIRINYDDKKGKKYSYSFPCTQGLASAVFFMINVNQMDDFHFEIEKKVYNKSATIVWF